MVPWGVFVLCCAVTSFRMMYNQPLLAWSFIGLAICLWLALVALAVWARSNDPAPTWFTYVAVMIGLSVFLGTSVGLLNFRETMLPYYEMKDLKVIPSLDAGKEKGANAMDAGVIHFAPGNHIDVARAWHFKHRELYCVAPIIGNLSVPETLSYDFWIVGKDCCSMSSSDFRCGAFANPNARSGVRLLDDRARPFYRLAVQQAEGLYGIVARHPIFLEWSQHPEATMNDWNMLGFHRFTAAAAVFFVFCVFCVVGAVYKYSWIGRIESVYAQVFLTGDPNLRGFEEFHHDADFRVCNYSGQHPGQHPIVGYGA